MDIALASVMRDGLLRRGEAAAATWADVTWEPDGSGRLLVRRSKTDPEGIGTVLFLSRHTAEDLRAIRPEDFTGRRPDLRVVGAADPPPAAGGREGGGPGRRVLGPQRPCRDGTGPRGVGDRAARADDGREVVEPNDAGAVHAGAAGRAAAPWPGTTGSRARHSSVPGDESLCPSLFAATRAGLLFRRRADHCCQADRPRRCSGRPSLRLQWAGTRTSVERYRVRRVLGHYAVVSRGDRVPTKAGGSLLISRLFCRPYRGSRGPNLLLDDLIPEGDVPIG